MHERHRRVNQRTQGDQGRKHARHSPGRECYHPAVLNHSWQGYKQMTHGEYRSRDGFSPHHSKSSLLHTTITQRRNGFAHINTTHSDGSKRQPCGRRVFSTRIISLYRSSSLGVADMALTRRSRARGSARPGSGSDQQQLLHHRPPTQVGNQELTALAHLPPFPQQTCTSHATTHQCRHPQNHISHRR